jgi:RHS repeat-associated protein
LEGGKVILETTGSDTLHYSYDSRGQLVSFSLNGTPYFYTRNGQGDITGLIDASGVEVVKYTYDSWGKPISITGSLALTVGAKNPYRYRGYRYDTESGLYYLQSRYYDPSIKRFISADSVIADVGGDIRGNNLYSYCFNNPVNMSDPSGHWPSWIGTLLISTAVVATVVSISIFLAPAAVAATSIYATTAIGGAIGFVGNVVKQVVFDNRSLDNMNVDELIRSTAAGAISGAFATISSQKTVQSLGNALIAGTNTAINGGSLSDIGLSAFIGLSAGYIGGPGGFDGFASSTSAQAPFISETLRNSSMMSFYASSTFKSGSVSFGLDFINGFAKTNLSAN